MRRRNLDVSAITRMSLLASVPAGDASSAAAKAASMAEPRSVPTPAPLAGRAPKAAGLWRGLLYAFSGGTRGKASALSERTLGFQIALSTPSEGDSRWLRILSSIPITIPNRPT